MARDVVLKFSANVTSLRQGMVAAAASVKTFEGQVLDVGKTSHETTRIAGAAMLAMGAAVAGGLALATRSAIQFEERMRNVSTISGEVEENFQAAGDAILAMSGELGIGANELAEGLYDVASSGFEGAAGLHIVEQAGIAAKAGLSTAAVAAQAITGAINAYGLSVAHAGDVSDIFFQTVNLGIVTFEELAENVGAFMSTSAAMNVALDEASAGFATITLAGIPAAEASTALNAVMTALLKPSGELVATLGALGYESAQAAIDALGLGGTLQMLRTATGDNTAAFAALFPNVRALKGALSITANEGATWNRVAGEITDKNKRAGAAAESLEKQQKSLGAQLKIAKEQIVNLAIGIGQSLLPVLRPMVGFVQDLAAGFGGLGKGAQQGAAGLAVAGAGLMTVTGAFLILGPKIQNAVTWFRTLAVTAPFLARSLQVVTVAAGLVGAALIVGGAILAHYGAQKAEAKRRTDDFVAALRAEQEGVEGVIDAGITKEIVDKELDKIAVRVGLSVETVTAAMRGEKEAISAVDKVGWSHLTYQQLQEAGYYKLRSAVDESAKGIAAAADVIAREDGAARAAARGTDALADSAGELGIEMTEATDAGKALLASLQGMVDLSDIYVQGQKAMEDAERDRNRAAGAAIRDEAEARSGALDRRHRAEREAVEVRGTAGQQEMRDLEARQAVERESADVTVESERVRADAIADAATKSTLSMGAWLKMTEEATAAQLARTRNLAAISARGGSEEAVAELADLPAEYAGVIAEIASSSDAGFAEFVRVTAAGSNDAAAGAKAEFGLLPQAIGLIGASSGAAFAANLIQEVRAGLTGMPEVLDLVRAQSNWYFGAGEGAPVLPGATAPSGLAEGKISRHPQIRTSAVLWAEAGPEAYIPLGPQYRSGAAALTLEVARSLGLNVSPMATGGFLPARSRPVGAGAGEPVVVAELRRAVATLEATSARRRPVEIRQTFTEQVDPLHVGREIAWALRR